MLNREREQEILNILKTENGFVTVKQLCDTLYASESSIRRDLKNLEKRGLVKRSYGGATPIISFSNIVNFNNRTKQNTAAKKDIAQKAVSLINDGDIIFLDSSSTTFYLAVELMTSNNITVITNNIEIMMLLANSNLKLVSSGGVLSRDNRSCLIGTDAETTFRNIFADFAFFSTRAISKDGIITDCTHEEMSVRNAMLKNAQKTVYLCDSTKFDSLAPYKQCHITDVDYLVCEQNNAEYYNNFKNKLILL